MLLPRCCSLCSWAVSREKGWRSGAPMTRDVHNLGTSSFILTIHPRLWLVANDKPLPRRPNNKITPICIWTHLIFQRNQLFRLFHLCWVDIMQRRLGMLCCRYPCHKASSPRGHSDVEDFDSLPISSTFEFKPSLGSTNELQQYGLIYQRLMRPDRHVDVHLISQRERLTTCWRRPTWSFGEFTLWVLITSQL